MPGEWSCSKETESQEPLFSWKSVLQRPQALIKYSPAIMATSNVAAVGVDKYILEIKLLGQQ